MNCNNHKHNYKFSRRDFLTKTSLGIGALTVGSLISSSNKIIRTELPFDKSNLQSSYLLDNGKEIYIEQFERGDRIWEYNSQDQSFKELTFVWNFIGLAKYCEGIEEKNIYFANNLEY